MGLITSNGTGGGLASATASWTGGVVPVEGDAVQVVVGDTITLDGVYIWGDDTATAITVDGEVAHSLVVTSQLTAKGDLTVNNNGIYRAGSSASRVPASITATLTLNYSATAANDKYSLIVQGGGNCEFYGDTGRNTQARLVGYQSGNLSSILVDDASTWQVGDTIVLHHISNTVNGVSEYRVVITGIVGNTVSFATLNGMRFADKYLVSNITKNVIINVHSGVTSYIQLKHLTTSDSGVTRHFSHVDAVQIDGSTAPRYAIGIFEGRDIAAGVYLFDNCAIGGIGLYETFRNISIDNCYVYEFSKNRIHKLRLNNVLTKHVANVGWGADEDTVWRGCCGACYPSQYGDVFYDCHVVGWWGRVESSVGVCYFHDCVFYRFTYDFIGNPWTTVNLTGCDYRVDYVGGDTEMVSPANHRALYMKNNSTHIDTFAWERRAHNDQNDPTFQWVNTNLGLYVRDTAIKNSSVASIQIEPMSNLSPTEYKTTKLVLSGLTINVSVYARKEVAFTPPYPKLVLKSSVQTVETVMSNIDDAFIQLTAQLTTTKDEQVDIILSAINNNHDNALCWFDDLIIDGVVHDIGDILFTGGTETSNVIDVTDTSKNVTLTGLISGSDVVILQAGTGTVLASVDQEPTTSYTFANPTPTIIDIGIIKQGYVPQYIYGYVLDKKGSTLPIKQSPDRTYQ